jgi:cytochrome c553
MTTTNNPQGGRIMRIRARHALTLLLAGGAASLLAGCHTKRMVGNEASIAGTRQVCASCHGPEGRSQNPSFPILAGQQREYLENQLHAFHDKTRADPHAHTYMWGMAANLDDATIKGLAAFFSSQRPATGIGQNPAEVTEGAEIFKNGIAAESVPACNLCHGEHGEGAGAIPRLAGQHRVYLVGQLTAFRTGSRANETMHANVTGMTDAQIRAISAYFASL